MPRLPWLHSCVRHIVCHTLQGNEKKGVTQATLDLADFSTAVPMVGFVESFNCSVAASLMLYEARHQRLARLGKHGDLGDEEKRLLRAAWLLRSVVSGGHVYCCSSNVQWSSSSNATSFEDLGSCHAGIYVPAM